MSYHRLLLVTAVTASVGAAAVYLVPLPALWRMSWGYALVFAVLGVIQLATTVAVVRRRFVYAAVAAFAVIVLWSLQGVLPEPDPWVPATSVIGFVDVICVGLEAVAVIGFGLLVVRWRPQSRIARIAAAAGVVPLTLLTVVGSVVGVAGSSNGFSGLPEKFVAASDLPAGRRSTVEYCRPDKVPLAMDIYTPANSSARPAPAVLYIHGGGLIFGNRELTGLGAKQANHQGALFGPLQRELNNRGFVVAAIDYRLPPATPWPAQFEDAKCAVRFLRTHAGDLHVDPDRIGVWGSSAGAQLSCLLGLADPATRVQAVVDMFGCVDLNDTSDSDPVLRASLRIALGNSKAVRRQASPNGHDLHNAPPFLILQGTEDPATRPRHSVALAQHLEDAGVPVTLITVHGAVHSLTTPGQRPTPEELTGTVVDFFVETLR